MSTAEVLYFDIVDAVLGFSCLLERIEKPCKDKKLFKTIYDIQTLIANNRIYDIALFHRIKTTVQQIFFAILILEKSPTYQLALDQIQEALTDFLSRTQKAA